MRRIRDLLNRLFPCRAGHDWQSGAFIGTHPAPGGGQQVGFLHGTRCSRCGKFKPT